MVNSNMILEGVPFLFSVGCRFVKEKGWEEEAKKKKG